MMGHSESENKKREGGKKEGGKEEGQDHSHIAQKRSDQFCIDDCMHAGEGVKEEGTKCGHISSPAFHYEYQNLTRHKSMIVRGYISITHIHTIE